MNKTFVLKMVNKKKDFLVNDLIYKMTLIIKM